MKLLIIPLLFLSSAAHAEIRIDINRTELKADIYQNNNLVNSYPVALGKSNSYTPLGSFYIRGIDVNPSWTGTRGQGFVPSGPKNPLGRIRMRYDPPYALHGTNAPNSIGTYASLGCIRMKNEDIIELTKLILSDENNKTNLSSMLNNQYKLYHIPLKNKVKITIMDR